MPIALSPFEITASEIIQLDVPHFARVLNSLLLNEGLKLGLPANQIKITDAIYTPDGGIDAIVDTRGRETAQMGDSAYLDPGLTVVQYKKSWPKSAGLVKELTKPAVQDAFQDGAHYILIVGKDETPKKQKDREDELRAAAREVGCIGTTRLYFATHVANWASTIPTVRLVFRSEIRGYLQVGQFLDRELRHLVAFEPDELRSATMADIEQKLFGQVPITYHARIAGPAGVGKSRLALELVKATGLADLTLYSQNVPSSELFAWIANDESIHATVVVDECDDTQALQLEQWAGQCEGRLRLITVGVGLGTGQDVYVLSPLDQAAIERVVQAVGPNLPNEQVRWIAEKSRGYVKLAVLVAKYVAIGRADIIALRSDREIAEFISRVIVPDPDRQLALKGVALLTHVGWLDEARPEGEIIAEFMGLTWERLQSLLQPLIREGVVVPRGRYWYVSPELLAVWLAADVWESQAHRVLELYNALPGLAARERLLERLSQLGEVASVRQVLEGLLSASGPFHELESLNNRAASRLFATIAGGVPTVGLAALERIIGLASLDELLGFDDGRQDIVWLLERLLERQGTFWGAARLVRSLAEAENARWNNNATAVWQSIFLTMLATTEVPAVERLVLIDEALHSDRAAVRLLGVRGLATALQTREISMGRALHGADVPPQFWTPQVWGEVWQAKREALSRLDRAMDDPSDEIRRAARTVILDHANDLVALHLTEDVVQRLSQPEGEDEVERRRIWEVIGHLLKYKENDLSEDHRDRLQSAAKRVYGDSLLDRIKRYTGLPIRLNELVSEATDTSIDQTIRQLAEDALQSPDELRSATPWLVSREATNTQLFGQYLGELDAERWWLGELVDAVKAGENPEILTAYLAGCAQTGHPAWREDIIDEWSHDPDLTQAVLDATMRGPHNDHAIARLLRLIDEGWLTPQVLGWLQYGSWVNDISESTLVEVVSRLVDEGTSSAITVALALCSDWFTKDPHASEDVRDLAWKLLEHTGGWQSEPMLSLHWSEVGKYLAADDPDRIAELVVRSYLAGETSLGDRRIEILDQLFSTAADRAWPVVGEALLAGLGAYRLAWVLEEEGLVLRVPPDIVIEWIRVHGPQGARVVASIVKPGDSRLPDLVRFLLVEYGDDVGGTIANNFHSGGWSGSETQYLDGKLEIARRWLDDADPSIRKWTYNVIALLEKERARAKVWDEEWDLR